MKHGDPKSSQGGLKTDPYAQGLLRHTYQFPQSNFLRKRLSIKDKWATPLPYSLATPRLGTNIGNNNSTT
jgi:hypothetical protein